MPRRKQPTPASTSKLQMKTPTTPVILQGEQTPSRWLKRAVVLTGLLQVVGAALYITLGMIPAVSKSYHQWQKTIAQDAMVHNAAFVRYNENDVFELDDKGKPKEIMTDQGWSERVRKKSFSVDVEYHGTVRPLTLSDKTIEIGKTVNNELYALSCEPIKEDQPGADNPKYTVTFYSKDAQQIRSDSWHEYDSQRPVDLPGCYYYPSFLVNGTPRDFSPRAFAKETVDKLNYKITYSKQDIAQETTEVVDLPLGPSPDGKQFLYDQVSAKYEQESCGGTVELPYKIPDFNGSINDLHKFDLTTKTDINLGSEKSMNEAVGREIVLDKLGNFSADSGRYYLSEGGRGGCRGANNVPIRIGYIDLHTNKVETISSPPGKIYSSYCFMDRGRYILEASAFSEDNAKTPPPLAPTVLNTQDSSTYQLPDLTAEFGCDWFSNKNSDEAISLVEVPSSDGNLHVEGDNTVAYQKLMIFNPAQRTVKNVPFDQVISDNGGYANQVGLLSDHKTGYIIRGSDQAALSTILFNIDSGLTTEVPYARLVL